MKRSSLLKWVIGLVLLILLVSIVLSNYMAIIYLLIGSLALVVYMVFVHYWGLNRTLTIAYFIVLPLLFILVLSRNTSDSSISYVLALFIGVVFAGSLSVRFWGWRVTLIIAASISGLFAGRFLLYNLINGNFLIALVIGLIFTAFFLLVYFKGWKNALVVLQAFAIATLLSLPALLLAGAAPVSVCNVGEVKTESEVTNYSARIKVISLEDGLFSVEEHVTYKNMESTCVEVTSSQDSNQVSFTGSTRERWDTKPVEEGLEHDLPGRSIQSTKTGLFLNEVIIPSQLGGYKCCPDDANIEIQGFPNNSFYDAQHVEDMNIDEYLGNVTVTLKTSDLEEGVRFAYMPSPYYYFRTLVTPILDLAKTDNLVMTLLGGAVTALFLNFINPKVRDFIKAKTEFLFKKKTEDSPQRKPPRRRLNRNQ